MVTENLPSSDKPFLPDCIAYSDILILIIYIYSFNTFLLKIKKRTVTENWPCIHFMVGYTSICEGNKGSITKLCWNNFKYFMIIHLCFTRRIKLTSAY